MGVGTGTASITYQVNLEGRRGCGGGGGGGLGGEKEVGRSPHAIAGPHQTRLLDQSPCSSILNPQLPKPPSTINPSSCPPNSPALRQSPPPPTPARAAKKTSRPVWPHSTNPPFSLEPSRVELPYGLVCRPFLGLERCRWLTRLGINCIIHPCFELHPAISDDIPSRHPPSSFVTRRHRRLGSSALVDSSHT